MSVTGIKELKKQVAAFEKTSTRASVLQIVNTVIPFIALWYISFLASQISYFLALLPIIIAAGFLNRVFIIFHDCTHNSFFKSRRANRIVGTLTGVMTASPYDKWGHEHVMHHSTSGNLDKRGTGDIWTLTTTEYLAAPPRTRLAYRFYRNPIVMFGIGPIYYFLLKNRFNRKGARKKERLNTYLTNALLFAAATLLSLAVGWKSFLIVHGSIFIFAGALGVWLFYVQHTFEDSYFVEDKEWDYLQAAVEGSSFYKLPKLFQWITGNIGYHHVHHLSPQIPNYKLEAAHQCSLPLQKVPTITLATSLRSLRFRLWDEERKIFVGFREIKSLIHKKASDETLPVSKRP